MPGIPALILLFLLSTIALLYGAIRSSTASLSLEGLQSFFKHSSPKERAVATATVAFPFWIWALWKVLLYGDPDLGVISFFLVLISCALVIFRSSNAQQQPSMLLLASNEMVSLNYALPFLFPVDLANSFKIYLAVGAVYWSFVAVWNWKVERNSTTENNPNDGVQLNNEVQTSRTEMI